MRLYVSMDGWCELRSPRPLNLEKRPMSSIRNLAMPAGTAVRVQGVSEFSAACAEVRALEKGIRELAPVAQRPRGRTPCRRSAREEAYSPIWNDASC